MQTDKTSVPPEPASRDWPLPELSPARLTGTEPVLCQNSALLK